MRFYGPYQFRLTPGMNYQLQCLLKINLVFPQIPTKYLKKNFQKPVQKKLELVWCGGILRALFSSDQSEMLLLTRLHVCNRSRVVERACKKTPPTGGPAGISHGSRMAGVRSQASAALCSIPDLPRMETSPQSKQLQLILNVRLSDHTGLIAFSSN